MFSHDSEKKTVPQSRLVMLRLDSPTSYQSRYSDIYMMNELQEDLVPPDNQLGLEEYARSFEDPCQHEKNNHKTKPLQYG